MYAWREMSDQERAEALPGREAAGWPWHAPPHFPDGQRLYLLTGTCYEHRPYLQSPERRDEWLAQLLSMPENLRGSLRGWVILPNHYHLLAEVDLGHFGEWIGRQHNGKSTQWNREDNTPGRKIWHRFTDRRIRSERHYFAALNYIHFNPVKHRWVARSRDWRWSSLFLYFDEVGEQKLREWWRDYPVNEMGEGWDD